MPRKKDPPQQKIDDLTEELAGMREEVMDRAGYEEFGMKEIASCYGIIGGTNTTYVDGVLNDGRAFASRFSLWRLSQTSPSDLGQWGGAVRPHDGASWAEFLGSDTAQIQIDGRNTVNVIISNPFSNSSQGTRLLIIRGADHYPERTARWFGRIIINVQ